MTYRGLRDPEGPRDLDLLQLVDLEKFLRESRTNRGQELRRGDFRGLKHRPVPSRPEESPFVNITLLPSVATAVLMVADCPIS